MEKQTELELELPGNDGSLGELLSMLETRGITIIRTQTTRVVDPVIVIGIAARPSGSAEFNFRIDRQQTARSEDSLASPPLAPFARCRRL